MIASKVIYKERVHRPINRRELRAFCPIQPFDDLPSKSVLEGASEIRFTCEDDVQVVDAHIRNPNVRADQSVKAGEVNARIGNNAVSTAPHIHIGAWKGETSLQNRFDLRALGQVQSNN